MTDREQIRRDAEQYADTSSPGAVARLASDYLALLSELERVEARLSSALEFMEHHQQRADQAERLLEQKQLNDDLVAANTDLAFALAQGDGPAEDAAAQRVAAITEKAALLALTVIADREQE